MSSLPFLAYFALCCVALALGLVLVLVALLELTAGAVLLVDRSLQLLGPYRRRRRVRGELRLARAVFTSPLRWGRSAELARGTVAP